MNGDGREFDRLMSQFDDRSTISRWHGAALAVSDWLEEHGFSTKAWLFRLYARQLSLGHHAWTWQWVAVCSDQTHGFLVEPLFRGGRPGWVTVGTMRDRVWAGLSRVYLDSPLEVTWYSGLQAGSDQGDAPAPWALREIEEFCVCLLKSKAKASKPMPVGFFSGMSGRNDPCGRLYRYRA